ncbi:MAG: DUF2797 domain-containing protein [Bacteroidetes bacterium]|nr:MAG: DUF2797 domain-containing protein [Bacteroidota bacterium]
MKFAGNILKMKTSLKNGLVDYFLPIGNDLIYVNELIGKNIKFNFDGVINCINCGKKINKTYFQGYCYNCFVTLPQTDECIIHPELCKAHLGISRDMEWAKQNCLQPHYVYLALSSDVKVGVTRASQVPTRWIDQGATQAIKFAQTPNRYTAGLIEIELKKNMRDKTNWRKMLSNQIAKDVDLIAEKQKACSLLSNELKQFISNDDNVTTIDYPVIKYPEKVKSLSFDKQSEIDKKLIGIKGQYLIFDDSTVLNIRKHNGYFVEVE